MKRYLVLEDGTVFKGTAFGADIESIGELVFTTGMCGYIETLTDPSYFGQIVLQTFPLIGNYGIIPQDFEGRSFIKGYVVREACDMPSNFRSEYNLNEYLIKNGIPGIYGVDTREITRHIREHGVMNAALCDEPSTDFEEIKQFSVKNAVMNVTGTENEIFLPENKKYRVVLMDFGAKKNIIRSLLKRGCEVISVPAFTKAQDILNLKPDGVMLSNGPGDPAENREIINEIGKLMGKIPMFGICLGHQLMALSQGAETHKLKYGHRGANQPVKDIITGRTYITSQNHGYAVLNSSIKKGALRFINANDMTSEGIDYDGLNAFSVQFHSEACSGPHDTDFLFDRFCTLLEKGGKL